MKLTIHPNATSFLRISQAPLQANEAANNLMLGLALTLKNDPQRYPIPPYLATVTDDDQLILAALCTPPHKLILFGNHHHPGSGCELIAEDLLQNQTTLPGVLGNAISPKLFATAWTNRTGQPHREGMQQRIYALRTVTFPRHTPGTLRQATPADIDLVARWALGFQEDTFGESDPQEARHSAEGKIARGEVYLWEVNGRPVSMAATARPVQHGITINFVYTPPDLRRHGYATACVATLSQLMLNQGWQFCCLHTDLANPTSNHIYQQIGYRPVGDFNEYLFSGAPSPEA